jgi:hypothetical protein
MANAQVENYGPTTNNNDEFQAIWQLTRALKTAGWRYKASADSVTKDTTGNPNNDLWGGGVIVTGQTATTSFTIGTPSTTSFGGRSTITGLTGFVAPSSSSGGSVGHFLKITGATNAANNGTWLITKWISATSVQIENPNAIGETTPGTATWTELSALLDTYPANITFNSGTGAWWNAQGPSVLKVPIGTAVPTGYIRGENVTQTTSNATGELLGVLTDTATGNGYLVISPRLSGTGAGVRGWSNTTVITGSTSGFTATPTATIIDYVREIVLWKNTSVLGHIYFQVIDSVGEATTTPTTGRFSTMAALATATATIAPGGATGGNPTTNGFPTVGSFVVQGQGGSGAASTNSQSWMQNSATVGSGRYQLLCANMIEDSLISGDGTFTIVGGTPANAATSFIGYGFYRLDDQEDGDVDPFVWLSEVTNGAYTRNRTNNPLGTTNNNSDVFAQNQLSTTISYWMGWKRRGFPTGDAWQEFQSGALGTYSGNTPLLNLNPTTADRVACSFVTTAVREPIWIASLQSGSKMRKGTVRWLYATMGGNGTDTYDGKRWIQLSSNSNGPWVVGPADTVTVPVNA